MFAKRATAAKLSIQTIHEGDLIANEQGNIVGVQTHLGPVSRVSVIATVVDRYKATQERLTEEGKGFSTLSLDDGTGVIRVKMWGELSSKVDAVEIGDLVLIVGRVRSFQGETYINGEIVRKLDNPNWETVRMLELTLSQLDPHPLEQQVYTTSPESDSNEALPTNSKQTELEPGVWHNATATLETPSEEAEPVPSLELRRLVIQTIEKHDSEGGARFEQILEVTGDVGEEVVEQVLIDLLSEGLVYEPEIHRYKKS